MNVKPANTQQLLQVFGKKGALQILELLKQSPRRYNELRSVVSSDRTLSQRLRELEECKLIETVSIKVEGRFFVHYKISTRGLEVLEKLNKI